MSKKVAKGKFEILDKNASHPMLYAVDLNDAIGIKFIVKSTDRSHFGGLGVGLKVEEVRSIFEQYIKDSNKEIDVWVVGGDGKDEAQQYVKALKELFPTLEKSISWNGHIVVSYSTNYDIHANYIALMGSEIDS